MKNISVIFLFLILVLIQPLCYASMKLYISDDCQNCKLVLRIGERLISDLEKKKELEVINVTNSKTNLPALPALIDDKKVIIGTGLIRYLADKTGTKFSQQEYLLLNDCPECPKAKNTFLLKSKEKILNSKSISQPLLIASVGLIDGINPCAFTTAIFFIGFLTFAGYQRKDMVLISSTFISGVFLTYLLLGMGVLSFLRSFKFLPYVSHTLTVIAIVLSFLFAILSLYDWYQYKNNKNPQRIILRLPNRVINKIHFLITSKLRFRTSNLLLISAFLGIGISVLESLCTGQMYIPTLTLISNANSKNQFLNLFVYNLMFIAPLIIVSGLGFFGINSEYISQFFRRNLGKIKLLTASVFCALGVLLIIGLN